MKIAYFSEVFLPKIDGVVNTLCRLFDFLEDQGHHSLLFAPDGGPDTYAGTPVVHLPGLPLTIYPDIHIVPPIVDVSIYLDQFQPDIIHLINPFSLGLTGLWYGLQKQIPVVASFQTDLAGFAEKWGVGYLGPLIWKYLRSIHNQADLNLAPSQYTRNVLILNDFKNVKIWGRGVDTKLFTPAKRCMEWRRKLSDDHIDDALLISVGRLSSEKNIKNLRPIMDQMPNSRLVIVGDGPQRQELEKIFSGTPTVFTGYLTGDELAQAYAAADIFVFTGENETFGNVVLEAMASGLPVIVPNTGGVVDFVSEYETGLIYKAGDIHSMQNKILELIHDPDHAKKIGENACEYARSQTWEYIFSRLLMDYRSLIINDSSTQDTSYQHFIED